MSRSIRVFWKPTHSPNYNATATGVPVVCNFNWPPINASSVVLVTASEYDPNAPASPDGSARRFIGAAQNIHVYNIAPHGSPSDPNHGVTFSFTAPWVNPLNICFDITVLDDAPQIYYLEEAVKPRG